MVLNGPVADPPSGAPDRRRLRAGRASALRPFKRDPHGTPDQSGQPNRPRPLRQSAVNSVYDHKEDRWLVKPPQKLPPTAKVEDMLGRRAAKHCDQPSSIDEVSAHGVNDCGGHAIHGRSGLPCLSLMTRTTRYTNHRAKARLNSDIFIDQRSSAGGPADIFLLPAERSK
jgi:hypothetical protein